MLEKTTNQQRQLVDISNRVPAQTYYLVGMHPAPSDD